MIDRCVAGCMAFTGFEIKHHKDCPHYEGSLSQQYDILKKQLQAKDKTIEAVGEWIEDQRCSDWTPACENLKNKYYEVVK